MVVLTVQEQICFANKLSLRKTGEREENVTYTSFYAC